MMSTHQDQIRQKNDEVTAELITQIDPTLVELGFTQEKDYNRTLWRDGQGTRIDIHFIGGTWSRSGTEPRLRFSQGYGNTVNLGVKDVAKTLARIKADVLNYRRAEAEKKAAAEAQAKAQADASNKIRPALEARYPGLKVEPGYGERGGIVTWEIRDQAGILVARYGFPQGTDMVQSVTTFPRKGLDEVLNGEAR